MTGGDAGRGAQGGRAPRPELTARELEVARLVSMGLRNREIAAALSVSVRTAESHVDQILTKLGFRSRVQIARWIVQREGVARLDQAARSAERVS